jgi:DNA gyrase subunit A
VLVFTSKGRLYWKKAYTIPDAGTASKGKNINGLVNLQPDETAKAFLMTKDFPEGVYVVMVTRNGVIKKCALPEFDNPRNVGIIALTLDEGDELISAQLSNGKQEVFIATERGMAIRFSEEDVRPMGRNARGVRGIDLEEGDRVVSTEILGEDDLILSISALGYGKRTPKTSYRLQSRGGKGVINMKTTAKTGAVVAVLRVKETTDLMIITKEGKIIRIESNEIRQAGRSTQGVRLVRMEEGDSVAAASVVSDGAEGEEAEQPGLELQ